MVFVKVHICENLEEFCKECNVPVPNEPHPETVWIQLSDKLTGINKNRISHPWILFIQQNYEAVESTFSRTTTPDYARLSSNPPLRVGTPRHRNCESGPSCPISLDAWVDFEVCTPVLGSSYLSKLKRQQVIDKDFSDKLKRETIYNPQTGLSSKAEHCENESDDIKAQLWTAFRLSKGLEC